MQRSDICAVGIPEEERKWNKRNIWGDNDWEISETDWRNQAMYSRSAMDSEQNKYEGKKISRQIIVKLLKTIAKREKIIISDQENYYCQLSHNVLQLTF